jgi:hypothetical protein
MQNIILALVISLLTSVASFAQCDKKVKWQASKAEMVDENGTVVDTKEGAIVITTDAKTVKFEIVGSDSETAEGTVSSTTCEWKDAFKNGKTTYKAAMVGRDGNGQQADITIEGKDGKLILTLELEKFNGKKVRVNIDKYETI